jgi:hypothetical protein
MNCYVYYDEILKGVIIDPVYTEREERDILDFVPKAKLRLHIF